MLTLISRHFVFLNCNVDFFSNYLVSRSTWYFWNSFISGTCDVDVDVDVEQGFVIFSILSVLHITSLIHIFELRA